MSFHFAEHYGNFRHWMHFEKGLEDAHLSTWKRVFFVISMTVFFLVMFIFL